MDHTIILIPTYNERQNLAALVAGITAAVAEVDLLVIDDNSPDGTGQLADDLHRDNHRVHVLHRKQKAGLGRAYRAGFAWALEHGYELIVTMDADSSHDPDYLPALLNRAKDGAAVAIGSRYVAGGKICGWSWGRHLLSWTANRLTKLLLGLRAHDVTAGYKCYRADFLQRVDLQKIVSPGYAFQVEMIAAAQSLDLPIVEIPIVFRDRTLGRSKVSQHELLTSAQSLLQLGFRRRSFREAGKFATVGLINVAVDLGLTSLFVAFFGIGNVRLAGYLATGIALLSSFLLNRHWTFRADGQIMRQFVRFALVNGFGAVINGIVYTLLLPHLHFSFAKLVAIGVAASWNFLGTRYWVFAGRPRLTIP